MELGKTIVKSILRSHKLSQYSKVYTKKDEIIGELPTLALREQMQDEIIIESDSVHRGRALFQIKTIIERLKRDGITFFVFDHQGKCPHIHVYDIGGLDKLDSDMRSLYIHAFLNKYAPFPEIDRAFAKTRQLIASEFQKHWKSDENHHYGVKELIYYNIDSPNMLDTDILKNIVVKKEQYKLDITPNYNRWIVVGAMNEALPSGDIDLIMFKNIMISVANLGIKNVKEVIEQIASNYTDVGGSIQRMKSWYQWAIAQPRTVSYGEIARWFENHNMSIEDYREKYTVKWKI
jgi:hypothetical protein